MSRIKTFLNHLYPYRYTIGLTIILLWGIFLRLYRITEIPIGLYPDIAANGLDIHDIMQGFITPCYYRNGGREGLFFWFATPFVAIFGFKPWPIYLASAVVGIITLVVMYWFGKTLFNRRIGLLATFLLASSFYHILFSRLGYRVITMPIFIMLTLIFLKRALTTHKNREWILAGIFLALGFYTYISYRIFPFVILLVWLYARWQEHPLLKISKPELKKFALSFGITFLPFFLFAVHYPAMVFGRTMDVSIMDQIKDAGTNVIVYLFQRGLTTLGMFNYQGDFILQYNIPYQPLLAPLEGILFIFGLIILFRRIKKPTNLLILILLLNQLVPIWLSKDVPHFLRGLGIIAPLYIICALPLEWLYVNYRRPRLFKQAIIIIVLICCGYLGYDRFFNIWANLPDLKREMFVDLVRAAEYMKTVAPKKPLYFVCGSFHYAFTFGSIPHSEIKSRLPFIPDNMIDPLIKIFNYDRGPEPNIDHPQDYFWGGNTIKYLMYNHRPYEVRAYGEVRPDEPGIYVYSRLGQPEHRKLILKNYPHAKSIYSDCYIEAFDTTTE